jgi:hypothetical protein
MKFSVLYNTPSDWIKGITAALTAGSVAFGQANLDGHVDGGEWVTILIAVVLAGATALGFYSEKGNEFDEPK